MEEDRTEELGQVRLPGFDEPAPHRRPGYGWYRDEYGPPPGYWQAGYARDGGFRSSRRASSWTAAALIAGVAATTGYLAHSIPTTGATTKTSGAVKHKQQASKARVQAPSAPAPAYQAPVVTSGGSGAAGGGGGDS
jgi:hypothetical protein